MPMKTSEFLSLIEDIAEVEPGSLKGGELLSDVEGWDSLSVVAFIAATDKAFGSAPSPASVVSARTVADLVATVADKLKD
jgi:acyl carrier protein